MKQIPTEAFVASFSQMLPRMSDCDWHNEQINQKYKYAPVARMIGIFADNPVADEQFYTTVSQVVQFAGSQLEQKDGSDPYKLFQQGIAGMVEQKVKSSNPEDQQMALVGAVILGTLGRTEYLDPAKENKGLLCGTHSYAQPVTDHQSDATQRAVAKRKAGENMWRDFRRDILSVPGLN
jgi:hypothetical protein